MDIGAVVAVYEAGDEDARLGLARNRVEWQRTCDLLARWLPPCQAPLSVPTTASLSVPMG